MERLTEFLETIRQRGLAVGHFRGVCHVAVGRTLTDPAGVVASGGITWRELAALLRDLKFDKNLAAEVGADPDDLAPRDRARFWYSAIALAKPDSPEARTEAEKLIALVRSLGWTVGPAPAPPTPKSLSSPPVVPPAAPDDDPPPATSKKKPSKGK